MKSNDIIRIDVSLPSSWKDLSQEQLRFFFIMLDVEQSMDSVITRCFLKWSGVKLVGRLRNSDKFLFRKDKVYFCLSSSDLWQWMRPLEFLNNTPEVPAIIQKYGRHKSVDHLFRGVRFGTYLSCVSIWSIQMQSQNLDIDNIKKLIELLYGFKPKRVLPEFVGCVIYWMYSIQEFFSHRFRDLFAPVSSDGQGSLGSSSFQESSNAMIRALTKGDVLKEKEVLDVDVWRALTELNAQAKEARSINESIKKK